MKLHLIRHGQTNWNAEGRIQGQSESELDSTGKQQAEARRSSVEALNVDAIYSSSSLRTRQTTDILTENINLPVTYLDSLREIFLGPWETQLWEDIEPQYSDLALAFRQEPQRFDLRGAESYHALQARGVGAIESIVAQESLNTDVLVVSHGALLLACLAHYAGIDLSQLWLEAPDNCSHSLLEVCADGQRIVRSVGGVELSATRWFQSSG